MKTHIYITNLILLSSLLFGDDFKPNPAWVTNDQGKIGYTVYESYTEVLAADPNDSEKYVYFSDKIWRGENPMFLESRVKSETISESPVGTSVLLKNADKWIELGLSTTTGPDDNTLYTFLLYEWDENNAGNRRSSFTIKDHVGAIKLGEVIEIGGGYALVKVGYGLHEWVDIIIIDLNNFRPKGKISFSEVEISEFTYGQSLKIRYKEPVTRAQILNDENFIDGLDWVNLDVISNGALNPNLINENDFDITVPAAQ